MSIKNGDRIYFPSGVTAVTAYQTAVDAVDEIDRTGMWKTRINDVPLYVRRLFGENSGEFIELSSPAKASSVWAIGYSLSSTGSAVGFMDMTELDREAMASGSSSGGSVNFDNIDFSFNRTMSLSGDGVRIDPQALPSGYTISFNVTYTNSSGTKRDLGTLNSITSRTYYNAIENDYGFIISDMGERGIIDNAKGVASLKDSSGKTIDTKSWDVTIYRGDIGSPSTTDTSNPITITIEKGASNNTIYPGISIIVASFAYVEPGYGTLSSLRLVDSQGHGWNLLSRNVSKVARNTFRGNTNNLPDRWMNGTTTLRLVAKNSINQETVIEENVITLRAQQYGGMSITSFISTDRSDDSTTVVGDGAYDSNVTGIPKFQLELIDSSGVVKEKTLWKDASTNGTNKWKIDKTFSDLNADSSYSIRLTLIDDINMQMTQTINIGGSAVSLSLGRYGAGVGVLVDDELGYDLQVGTNGIYSYGPIYSNGVEVGGGNWEVKTQAQYDALTTAQKNDKSKLYLIKI